MATTEALTSTNGALVSTAIATSSASLNGTASLLSTTSAKDIVLAPLNSLVKLDRFLFTTLPRAVARTIGLNNLATRVADIWQNTEVAAAVPGAHAMPQAAHAGTRWTDIMFDAFQQSSNRSYWGMLHYTTSRWAFTCFIMALIINRISVYGSSRQRITLTWNKRLALRLIPCILFVSQMHRLLQAIHCQTSPEYSLYRHGDNNLYSILDWSTDGGVLHTISSNLLFWSSDQQSCAAVGMSRPEPDVRARYGSFSLLWPTFLRLSLSHLVENLSCSLQQIAAMNEVGLSVFEHSLAFAEAESMVANTLNRKIGTHANATATTTSSIDAAAAAATATLLAEGSVPISGALLAVTDAAHSFMGSHTFDRVNVPAEVLLVAFLSCGNCLTSHIISVLGKKQKWRLINTAFWGLLYMTAFTWGFLAESELVRVDSGVPKPVSGLLHFPTVAIVGFLPHMAIILGVLMCGMIYMIALLFTAVSLGTNPGIRQPTSLKERICIAHDNLQAAMQIKSIDIRWYEDFYTALLRIGFAALTAASEAVFLNEGRAVEMRQFTWLEEERLDELETSRSAKPSEQAHFQIVEEYGIPQRPLHGPRGQMGDWKSGYEKERKLERQDKTLQAKGSFVYPNPRTDGVGALQRTTRFYLLFIFLRGILFTLGGWTAFGIGAFLDRLGMTARPPWLRRVIGPSVKQTANDRRRMQVGEEADFRQILAQQSGISPRNEEFDVEAEMRQTIASEGSEHPEEELDRRMYEWWRQGGWYGDQDDSGDYVSRCGEQDEDATSVITTTTASSVAEDDHELWESEPEGTRTPTQRFHTPAWSFAGLRRRRSVSFTPEPALLDNATLARLLNPRDRESQTEAKVLSAHLSSDGSGVMTRARYNQHLEADRAKVLLAGRVIPQYNIPDATSSEPGANRRRPLRSDEEALALEQLLTTRRAQKGRNNNHGAPLSTRASSPAAIHVADDAREVPRGPPCVVCQSEPRSIIAWPCRCLTVCEDCRVNLAMNNFGNCVTCRRSVGGFVRLYVP